MEKVIVKLIVDDIHITRLINGLDVLGIDASKYYMNISFCVFELLGLNSGSNEELYNAYFSMIKAVEGDEDDLKFAQTIYDFLTSVQLKGQIV